MDQGLADLRHLKLRQLLNSDERRLRFSSSVSHFPISPGYASSVAAWLRESSGSTKRRVTAALHGRLRLPCTFHAHQRNRAEAPEPSDRPCKCHARSPGLNASAGSPSAVYRMPEGTWPKPARCSNRLRAV